MIPIIWMAAPALLVAAYAISNSGSSVDPTPSAEPPPQPPLPEPRGPMTWKALPDYGGTEQALVPKRERVRIPRNHRSSQLPKRVRSGDLDFGDLHIPAIRTSSMDFSDMETPARKVRREAPRGRGELGNVMALSLPEATESARLRFLKGPVHSVTQGNGEIVVQIDSRNTGFLSLPLVYLGWPIRIVE